MKYRIGDIVVIEDKAIGNHSPAVISYAGKWLNHGLTINVYELRYITDVATVGGCTVLASALDAYSYPINC